MKRGKLFKVPLGILLVALLVTPSIIAIQTEVRIKTMPFHEVQITAFDPYLKDFSALDRFIGNSDGYGDLVITFDLKKDEFNLMIYIKKDGEKILPGKKFPEGYLKGETYTSGEPVYIEIAPSNFEFINTPGLENKTYVKELVLGDNESIGEIVEETNGSEEKFNSLGTGLAVQGEGGIFSKGFFYFIIGFLFLLALAGFTVGIIKKKKLGSPKEITVKKISEIQKENRTDLKDKLQDYNQAIEAAEKKINEAQKEINKLKNQEKIKDLKKKIEENERELIKLRQGED